MNNIDQLIKILVEDIKGSSFNKISEQWLKNVEIKYPGIPSDLKYLYDKLGYGCIGQSRYMIHALLEPEEIYDSEISKGLEGIFIVGDDFAGNCEAYNAKKGWVFGGINYDGIFEEYGNEIPSFINFLNRWFVPNEGA